MPRLDLHQHTKYSDGTETPAEVFHSNLKAGTTLMAITDHDTVEALEEIAPKARAAGISFVNGVEISAKEHNHLHILGYGVDYKDKEFLAFLHKNRLMRETRIKTAIKQLQESGLDIEEQEVTSLARNILSRAHIADALKKKGIVPNRQEAFRKFLVKGKAGYVPAMAATAREAIGAIKKAGGLAFLAHPGLVKEIWDFPAWTTYGLSGIEVYYPSHSFELKQDLLAIAKKYKLLVSGGSDYHGRASGRHSKPGMEVPQEVYDKLKSTLVKN